MTNNFSAASSRQDTTVIEVQDQGVIWSAVIGGAVAASAFTIILTPLGTSLGFMGAMPAHTGDTAEGTFTLISAIWLIIMQWISSGVGGYLTGRLRTGWVGAHTHEVFFRDTAHGFLTWALATVVGVILLAMGFAHATENHMHRGAMPENYAVSQLLRSEQTNAPVVTEQDRMDVSIALHHAAAGKNTSDADKAYLVQLVEARTGLAGSDAERRVDETVTQLRETEHAAHRAMAVAGLFIFFAMWIGAFIASAAAAAGTATCIT